MDASDEAYEFFGRVAADSLVSRLIEVGGREVWIPKSQVLSSGDELEIGVQTNIEIPTWLAEREGIV